MPVDMSNPYPYQFDPQDPFADENERAELAEGVAFDAELAHLSEADKLTVDRLIGEYLTWIVGPSKTAR